MLFTYPGGEVIIALLRLDSVREDCAATAAVNSSASEVTTLWRYTNLFIIIIIIINLTLVEATELLNTDVSGGHPYDTWLPERADAVIVAEALSQVSHCYAYYCKKT